MYQSYEDLDVWKRSCGIAINVIRIFQDCRNFPIKNQVTKSAFSVPSNIAEGAERDSRLEFIRFLNIAKGSAAELRTQLYICKESHIIAEQIFKELYSELNEISAMLQGLIKYYRSNT